MKKIYMILAAMTLLSLSLNAQLLPSVQKTLISNNKSFREVPSSFKSPEVTSSLMNGNTMYKAPSRANLGEGEYILGPYTTDDYSSTGWGLTNVTTVSSNAVIWIGVDMDLSEYQDYLGDEIVGYRFATIGQSFIYDVFVLPMSENYLSTDNMIDWELYDDEGYPSEFSTGWNEVRLDTPIEFSFPDSIQSFWLGYRYFQFSSSQSYNKTPVAYNANSTSHMDRMYWNSGMYNVSSYVGGDIAIQLIMRHPSTNPTIEISPATQTISDAAAGTVTVTGTDIDGNINVSAADNDWTVNPTSLGNTGGNVSVTYTGRDLSASTTVTASATGATDATATVNYVADLYIVDDFGSGWDFNNGTSMTYANGTYTATLTVDAGSYILFARLLGNSNPWNTRDVFGPDSNGDWWMQGNSASGNIDLNDDDPIYFQEGGTYRITINANDGTFTITKLHGEQTAAPEITYSVSSDGEHVTITATGDGTVTLNVPGYDSVSGDGEVSITVPCGYVSNTITVSATAQEDGKDESDPATAQVNIPAGSGWIEMDGTYNNPNDLLSFLKDGEDIMMLDQFTASTLNNSQPASYIYTLREGQPGGEQKMSTPVPIPVYKTFSTMQGVYTKNQVDNDKYMKLKSNVLNAEMDFDVKPDGNVLYYNLYRSNLNGDYPVIDDTHRVSKLQQFDEQVGDYSQFFLFESHTSGVMPRYDHVGNGIVERLDTNYVQGEEGNELSYVPVIWTLGINSARGDGKDNTYGSDIKRETLGNVTATISGTYTKNNEYGTWDVGNTEYCVFHPTIDVTGLLPQAPLYTVNYNDGDVATYEPYLCRAWCTYEGIHDFVRNSDNNLEDAGALQVPYWLGDATFDNSLSATIGGDWTGGAIRDQWSFGLPSGTNPNEVTYIIRFYYKKVVTDAQNQQNGSKLRDGSDSAEYFIVQTGGEYGEWVVGINELNNGIVPVDVTYVNPQGMKSSRPFDGVNIVVTRYSDGSTRTTKIIR